MHTRSAVYVVVVSMGLVNVTAVLIFSLIRLPQSEDRMREIYVGMISTILGLSITLVVQALSEYRKIRMGRDRDDVDRDDEKIEVVVDSDGLAI